MSEALKGLTTTERAEVDAKVQSLREERDRKSAALREAEAAHREADRADIAGESWEARKVKIAMAMLAAEVKSQKGPQK